MQVKNNWSAKFSCIIAHVTAGCVGNNMVVYDNDSIVYSQINQMHACKPPEGARMLLLLGYLECYFLILMSPALESYHEHGDRRAL